MMTSLKKPKLISNQQGRPYRRPWRKCDKQENGNNLRVKLRNKINMKRVDKMTQRKEDIINESLENAYRIKFVQKDNSNSNCKKCEVSFKKQEKFREHLIEDHKYKCA